MHKTTKRYRECYNQLPKKIKELAKKIQYFKEKPESSFIAFQEDRYFLVCKNRLVVQGSGS